MKKEIILPLLFAGSTLLLSSCMKEELEPAAPSSVSGKTLVFEGDFTVSTKIQYGDAEDGIHTLTWTEGDAIGIFSYDQTETMNNNIRADLHSSTYDVSKGIFIPVDEIIEIPPTEEGGEPTEGIISIEYPQNSDETFVVYYPYRSGTELSVDDGSLHSTVANEQTQDAVGDRKVLANGFATGIAEVAAGSGKATFALTHRLAYITVKATSSEFSGYQLHSVQLFDRNGQAALTGDFAIEPIEGTLSVTEGTTGSSVRVDVQSHDFSAAPEKSELYLAVLPGDYSSADMYIAVTFINADGATQTVPMKFDKKCVFPSGSLTTIDLGDIKSSDNVWPWYSTSEKRDLVKRWAYGPQNTYFAERPENNGESTRVTIDVKARGDFSKVKEPKYYSLLLPSEMGDPGAVTSGVRAFLSTDGTKDPASITSGSTTEPNYLPVDAGYTITVYVLDQILGTGRWGTVALYDEDKNIIWSFMVQGYKKGDAPQDVNYPGFTLLDRCLGQGNGNRKAEADGDFDSNAPAYFQWGRKDPLTWSNSSGLGYIMEFTTEPVADVGDAASIPTTKIVSGDRWYEGDIHWELWGGYNNTDDWYDPEESGAKTIYDPCPEGYRVPDARVFKEVGDNTEIWEMPNGHALQVTDASAPNCYLNPESPFYAKYSTLAYKLQDGTYDYWPFLGYLSNGTRQYAERSSNNNNNALETWANSYLNSAVSAGNARGVTLEYGYWSKERLFNSRHDAMMTYAYPVRCQKDDLGR